MRLCAFIAVAEWSEISECLLAAARWNCLTSLDHWWLSDTGLEFGRNDHGLYPVGYKDWRYVLFMEENGRKWYLVANGSYRLIMVFKVNVNVQPFGSFSLTNLLEPCKCKLISWATNNASQRTDYSSSEIFFPGTYWDSWKRFVTSVHARISRSSAQLRRNNHRRGRDRLLSDRRLSSSGGSVTFDPEKDKSILRDRSSMPWYRRAHWSLSFFFICSVSLEGARIETPLSFSKHSGEITCLLLFKRQVQRGHQTDDEKIHTCTGERWHKLKVINFPWINRSHVSNFCSDSCKRGPVFTRTT